MAAGSGVFRGSSCAFSVMLVVEGEVVAVIVGSFEIEFAGQVIVVEVVGVSSDVIVVSSFILVEAVSFVSAADILEIVDDEAAFVGTAEGGVSVAIGVCRERVGAFRSMVIGGGLDLKSSVIPERISIMTSDLARVGFMSISSSSC